MDIRFIGDRLSFSGSPATVNLIPIEAVKATYERAREPKAISILPITHFEAYHDPWWSKAADLAIDWFRKHLG